MSERGTGMAVGGIVLCGGESRRMGRPKALLPAGGETMLQRVVRTVGDVTSPVVVVAAVGMELPRLGAGVEIVRDSVRGQGPLQGLVDGLRALEGRAGSAYAASCDVPLLRSAVVRRVVDGLGDAAAAAVREGERWHPLAATYHISTLQIAVEMLASGNRRMTDFLARCEAVEIEADRLRDIDPDLLSLRNINTPEAYEEVLKLIAAR